MHPGQKDEGSHEPAPALSVGEEMSESMFLKSQEAVIPGSAVGRGEENNRLKLSQIVNGAQIGK